MEIRKVTERDREAIRGIIEATDNLTREEKDCATELLDIYLGSPNQRDYSFLAAAQGGHLAGYACYGRRPLTEGAFDLYWIIVHPEFRKKGVGKALLARMEALLSREGARLILAETSGLDSYATARNFYTTNGFTEEARIRDFYKPGDDIIVYVKRL